MARPPTGANAGDRNSDGRLLLSYGPLTRPVYVGRLRPSDAIQQPQGASGLFPHERRAGLALSGSLPTWVLSRHPEKTPNLALTVAEVSAGEVRLRLHGSLPIRYAGWDVQNRRVAAGDYDCAYEFLGRLTYDRRKESFARFDLVALGAVQQLGPFQYPRPEGGALTIGVTFAIGDGTLAERIPPPPRRGGRSTFLPQRVPAIDHQGRAGPPCESPGQCQLTDIAAAQRDG